LIIDDFASSSAGLSQIACMTRSWWSTHTVLGGSGKRMLADGLVLSPSAKPLALPLPFGDPHAPAPRHIADSA
jgi:hypothetical protein